MRILALGGAGAVAREATRDLCQFGSLFREIVIADIDPEKAERLAREIGDPRLRVIPLDVRDEEALVRQIRGFDVVMNGLPFAYDVLVTRACVEAGVSGVDLAFDEAQFELDEQARSRDMVFIPGVGATPGTTNVMAAHGARHLDQVEAIEIAFAAFRCLAPSPGLLRTTLWEFNPEEPERAMVYWEDGAWRPAPPFSGEKRVRFHEQIGEQTVYYVPHDEARTLPRSFPGLRRAAVRGCFPPHVMRAMRTLYEMGALSSTPVPMEDRTYPAIELIARLLLALPASRSNPIWAYGLVVEVHGRKDGRPRTVRLHNRHPPQDVWGGEAAYYRNIGVPLSIAAQMIARGEITARGVVPPERAIPPERFFEELARRGIEIIEERE
ncbi:saccharopine dehydrogenase family protein [Thermoflexus sp.]|uniref:saccharopine dehydrogenase family protein n=1 Tax=Thermoflexus sp. TaxID=1969742 RepID=UPI002ADE21A0|nr:saccharopine dehydrogenase NADP-binding domain-containing protein [Thermoflexus sp.]